MNRETSLEHLKRDLAAGRVVVVSGTGVSVAATANQLVEGHAVATLPGLLRHGLAQCARDGLAGPAAVSILTSQIDSGELDFLIAAADYISQRMKQHGEGVFRGWLKETLGRLELRDRALPDALAALPALHASLALDDLLARAADRRPVTWLHPDAVQDVLRGAAPDAVLHPHGCYREPASVALGLRSFLPARDQPHARAVLDLFALDRTLLFVGCGDALADPTFARLLEWAAEALRDVAPRHYVLCRGADVAGVQQRLAGAPWLRPLAYGDDDRDLAPFLRSFVAAPSGGRARASVAPKGDRPAGPGFDLDEYRQATLRRYGRLKLEELDATTHDTRLTLTGMFVAPHAREYAEIVPHVLELPKELQQRLHEGGELGFGDFDEEALEKHRRTHLDQAPRPILEILDDPGFPRLVVLGDPGSGKSTLLQWLLLQWAESAPAERARAPLPLLLELRDYTRHHDGRAHSFLRYFHEGAGARHRFDGGELDAWLKANPSLLLFDGLDEVFDPDLRREVATSIHRLANEYPLARVVVTSRVVGYLHQGWRDEGFRHIMLQDLDGEQVDDFLARWHRGAYEEPTRGEAKHALLARAIEDSPAIRQLASNPLLLTMMAILNRTQDLPRDRAELYEQCARLLLHQWKVDLAFVPYPELSKASLDFRDKRGLLLRVARAMQAGERGLAGNLIDEASLESTLEDGLKGIPNLRPDRAARALIEQLRSRNFMLCSVGGRSYAFVHRTFLEYFCALDLRERFERERSLSLDALKKQVFGNWPNEAWHEVLRLLAAMVAAPFMAEVLAWLLAQPDPDETCRHVFLAAHCVGEVRKRNELRQAAERVLERTKQLTRFDLRGSYEQWSEAAQRVATVRARAVGIVAKVWQDDVATRPWLEGCLRPGESWVVRRSALRELARGWRDAPQTLPLLKAHAQADENWAVRLGALEELVRGWKDDPETLPWLRARAKLDHDDDVRRSALQNIALVWWGDPTTAAFLEERTQLDASWVVRQSAVQALARGWKHERTTLTWLRARVQADANWDVRQRAMQELARGWKDEPETLPLLKSCARFDPSEDVRRTAIQELARCWKGDPAILPVLKARAQADAHEAVRQSALQALARGWKGAPETLPLVRACARTDPHEAVRQVGLEELCHGWKDDPDTFAILEAHAQADESAWVRRNAVQALAQTWRGAPATLRVLEARARSDAHAAVRQSALEALARDRSVASVAPPSLEAGAPRGEDKPRRPAPEASAGGRRRGSSPDGMLRIELSSEAPSPLREEPSPPFSPDEDSTATVTHVPEERLWADLSHVFKPAPDDEGEWFVVYEKLIRFRKRNGEPIDDITFEKFRLTLRQSRDAIAQQHACKKVKFSVCVKDGRTTLKASPILE